MISGEPEKPMILEKDGGSAALGRGTVVVVPEKREGESGQDGNSLLGESEWPGRHEVENRKGR